MKELCYSALDVAVILNGLELNGQKETLFLNRVWEWEWEQCFLQKEYRSNKRKWLLCVLHWSHYFYDKSSIDAEFPAVQRDALVNGGNSEQQQRR